MELYGLAWRNPVDRPCRLGRNLQRRGAKLANRNAVAAVVWSWFFPGAPLVVFHGLLPKLHLDILWVTTIARCIGFLEPDPSTPSGGKVSCLESRIPRPLSDPSFTLRLVMLFLRSDLRAERRVALLGSYLNRSTSIRV